MSGNRELINSAEEVKVSNKTRQAREREERRERQERRERFETKLRDQRGAAHKIHTSGRYRYSSTSNNNNFLLLPEGGCQLI